MAKEKKIPELFAFNLLPPKTKEELIVESRKATSKFYTTLLPIFCLALALLLFLLNTFVVGPTKDAWAKSVDNLTSLLNNPNSATGKLKTRNGELKTKTDFIATPVQKNVDFEQIFAFADKIFGNNATNSKASSYGREDTGIFVINAYSPNPDGPAQILAAIKQDPEVKDVDLRSVKKDNITNNYQFTVSFNFIVIKYGAGSTTTKT